MSVGGTRKPGERIWRNSTLLPAYWLRSACYACSGISVNALAKSRTYSSLNGANLKTASGVVRALCRGYMMLGMVSYRIRTVQPIEIYI